MNLYIQVENGEPINHPAFEDNLIQAFGAVPSNWEAFIRIPKPTPAANQIFDSELPTYQKVNGIWTDVWALRDMTESEIVARKLDTELTVKAQWAARPQAINWEAWTFDEVTCSYVPPIPRPPQDDAKEAAGVYTFWCGADGGWKDTPAYPSDGTTYKFDFLAWQWVQDVN